jgi:hypothetical protein
MLLFIILTNNDFVCFFVTEIIMPARKSMLGKRKHIPRPTPVQPPVSAIKRRLGTGKKTALCLSVEQ